MSNFPVPDRWRPPTEDMVNPNRPPRDKRWFLRKVGVVILAIGSAVFVLAMIPSGAETPGPQSAISTKLVLALASLPFIASGALLVWWGYTKAGEPLVACQSCLHINKARSTVCSLCGFGPIGSARL